MVKHKLKAEARKVTGRKVKNLRKEGVLPANIYGKKVKSLSIQVPSEEFKEVYKEAGETGIVEIKIGSKEERPSLIHNVQVNPVTGEVFHVDFLQVDLKEKVTANVPVEVVGESPAEKQAIGTVVQQTSEIEVEALPMDLPEKFEVDQSVLAEVDQSIKISDLKIDKSKLDVKNNPDDIIIKVEPPQKEEVIEPAPQPEGEEGEAAEGEGEAQEQGVESTEEPKAEESNSDQSA